MSKKQGHPIVVWWWNLTVAAAYVWAWMSEPWVWLCLLASAAWFAPFFVSASVHEGRPPESSMNALCASMLLLCAGTTAVFVRGAYMAMQ